MWPIIISLVAIGLALIILEIVFVPGTTFVGLAGIVLTGVAIVLCFQHYGSEAGWYLLLGTAGATAVALYFSFRSNAWQRFANKSVVEGRVNEGLTTELQVGDEGVALSTLKPYGTARFGEKPFEVRSLGDYVDVGTKVRIFQIQGNQIIVKPVN